MKMPTKQVLVLRKDLNMRKGKMIAQGSHACLKAIIDLGRTAFGMLLVPIDKGTGKHIQSWMEDNYTKIAVSVNSEDELFEIYRQAKEATLPCSLIKDAGLTEFKEPTYTAVAIGPGPVEKINKITGHLPLL